MTSKSESQSYLPWDRNTFLLEDFEERRGFERHETLPSEIVNRLLRLLHPGDVVGKRGLVISRFCRVETQEFG